MNPSTPLFRNLSRTFHPFRCQLKPQPQSRLFFSTTRNLQVQVSDSSDTASSLSSSTDPSNKTQSKSKSKSGTPAESEKQTKLKTVAQADDELRNRLEQMSGEGGAAGIEYEDGKPTAMKRSVRNNMFRLI